MTWETAYGLIGGSIILLAIVVIAYDVLKGLGLK